METAYPALICWRYLHLFGVGVEVGLRDLELVLLGSGGRTLGGLTYHSLIHLYGSREWPLFQEGSVVGAGEEEHQWVCQFWMPGILGVRCMGESGGGKRGLRLVL